MLPTEEIKYNFIHGYCENKIQIRAQTNCDGIKKDVIFCSGKITDVCGDGKFKLVPKDFPDGFGTGFECQLYHFTFG